MPKIISVRGLEILDSRGRPTVKAYMEIENNIRASASVPSGASTGRSEAHELRDGEQRYDGLGCRKAVANINKSINLSISGKTFDCQADIDEYLLGLDGTSNKSKLGANALLAVSLAFSRCLALSNNKPLFSYYQQLVGSSLTHLPRPTINLFSGGKHAGGQIPLQDLLIVPMQKRFSEVMECAYAVYQAAAVQCLNKFNMRALTADEGGLAPPFGSLTELFDTALESIEQAGYRPGEEVQLALDIAASHFYHDDQYFLTTQGSSGSQMIDVLSEWTTRYPIRSIEDGLAEDDWEFWPKLVEAVGDQCEIMGDDFLCTNPERIKRAVSQKGANALLLKVNQIGTLSEALKAFKLAKEANWKITVSARSGETEDNWLSDLAVGWQADYIKIGSVTQSERLAKYNRLLEIEQETGFSIKD